MAPGGVMQASIGFATLVLALGAPGCGRHRRPRGRAAVRASQVLQVAAPEGPALRLGGGRFVVGGHRLEGTTRSASPFPASAFVGCAETAGGWHFVAQDGTLYAAPGFTGPLRKIGWVPAEFPPPTLAGFALGAGALAVVDTQHRAWWVDPGGAAREIPVVHALAVVALDAREGLVVDGARGVLRVRDGGRAVTPIDPPPAGLPLALARLDDRVVLRTTEGGYAWREGAFVRDPAAPDVTAARAAGREIAVEFPTWARTPLPLPASADQAAGRDDGAVDVLRDAEIVRYDARTARVRRRSPAPGRDCTLHRAADGTRAVCIHQGWARAVFREAPAWVAVRDELRAEPMGPVAFDARTPVWAVGAPCTQRPTRDGRAACVYRDDGHPVDVALPFEGVPVAVEAGRVLFVETLRDASRTAAAVWHDGGLVPITLPVSPAAAQGARWEGDTLVMREGTTLVRVRPLAAGDPAPARSHAPAGATVVVRGERATFAVGPQGAWRWQGAGWAEMALAMQGGPRGRDLARGEGWCAGPWCRLSDTLWWSAVGTQEFSTLADDRAALPPAPGDRALRPWRCTARDTGPGVDLDRGVAVDGRSLEVARVPSGLAVRWHGVAATAAGAVPGLAAGPLQVSGVPGEGGPAGLIVDQGFLRVVAVPGHLVTLPDRVEGHTDLTRVSPTRLVVRTLTEREGALEVDLFALDATTGAVQSRRRLALGHVLAEVSPGAWEGVPGLFLHGAGGLRFVPAEGETGWRSLGTRELPAVACAEPGNARGMLHRRTHLRGLRGEAWMADWREWTLDEMIRLGDGNPCVVGLAGGEARDEREMEGAAEREGLRVRALRLQAGAGQLRGVAWAGERRLALLCTSP